MPVDVRLPTQLRSQAGGRSVVQVAGSTVGEILSSLVTEYPGMGGQLLTNDGRLQKFVNVYVNDDDVRYLSVLETPVEEGDEISILPAVAGGSGPAVGVVGSGHRCGQPRPVRPGG